MIAISSFRPFADSETIFKNQFDAKRTWESVFDEIVYFGAPEKLLSSRKTSFVECEGKPRIKDMATLAANGFGWKAIINADIQVKKKAREMDHVLNIHGADCAFSFRIPVGGTERVDMGIDFFCAKTDVWRKVAETIPEKFTLGRQVWDTWVCAFFMRHFKCVDLSPCKMFMHPEHGERADQSMEIEDPYLKNMVWRCKPVRF